MNYLVSGCMGMIKSSSIIPQHSPTPDSRFPTPHHCTPHLTPIIGASNHFTQFFKHRIHITSKLFRIPERRQMGSIFRFHQLGFNCVSQFTIFTQFYTQLNILRPRPSHTSFNPQSLQKRITHSRQKLLSCASHHRQIKPQSL